MAKRKDYRDILKKILEDHPEIAAINIEYKKTDRLTLGETQQQIVVPDSGGPVHVPQPVVGGYISPSGLRPIVPNPPTPEELAALKNGAHIEEVKILNAPPAKK